MSMKKYIIFVFGMITVVQLAAMEETDSDLDGYLSPFGSCTDEDEYSAFESDDCDEDEASAPKPALISSTPINELEEEHSKKLNENVHNNFTRKEESSNNCNAIKSANHFVINEDCQFNKFHLKFRYKTWKKMGQAIAKCLQQGFYERRGIAKKESEVSNKLEFIPKFANKDRYGGNVGMRIFEEEKTQVIIPTLVNFLKYYKDEVKDVEKNHKKLLYGILLALGKERGDIAIKTKSSNKKSFGLLFDEFVCDGDWQSLMDPINKNSFPSWNDHVRNNVLPNALRENTFEQLENNTFNDFHYAYIPYVDDKDISWCNSNFTSVFRIMVPSKIYDKMNKDKKKHLDLKDENIEICCCHLPRRAYKYIYEEKIFKSYCDAFIKAYLAENEFELKKNLAVFIRNLSISSTYVRGQAAITSWIISALCQYHGYDLSYSKAWTRPEGISEDMHALSHMNDELAFVKAFMENSFLTKRLEKQ
jgi:hypothetical protein